MGTASEPSDGGAEREYIASPSPGSPGSIVDRPGHARFIEGEYVAGYDVVWPSSRLGVEEGGPVSFQERFRRPDDDNQEDPWNATSHPDTALVGVPDRRCPLYVPRTRRIPRRRVARRRGDRQHHART